MTTSDNLPEDVLIQALLCLPVISLMRFKTVCKSWRALIEDSHFISKHLHQSSLQSNYNTNVLVKRSLEHQGTSKDNFLLLSGETFDVSLNIDTGYLSQDDWGFELLGSCNGILCLVGRKYRDITLWNPATKESRILPESSIPLDVPTNLKVLLGFGFHVETNDYKVVKIGWTHDDLINNPDLSGAKDQPDEPRQVEIYSLRTDSWRLLDTIPPFHIVESYSMAGECLSGISHWLAWPRCPLTGLKMLSFDMTDEVFRTTRLPDVFDYDNYHIFTMRFLMLNESPTLVINPSDSEECFETWVLDGVTGTWTKLYRIGPFSGDYWPLGFSKSGELFMERSNIQADGESEHNNQLELCNPLTQEIRSLQVDAEPSSLELFSYTESLVSIERRKRTIDANLSHITLDRRHDGGILVNRRRHFYDKNAFFFLYGENFEMCVDLPYFMKDKDVRIEILGSCNGIICLRDERSEDLALWNPTMKDIRALPPPNCVSPVYEGINCKYDIDYGLWFDVKTSDYKLVRIPEDKREGNRVEVYSLSTDSWRIIDAILPIDYIISPPRAAVVNGICYWVGRKAADDVEDDNVDDEDMILSFDFSNNEFRILPLPVPSPLELSYNRTMLLLTVLNESVSFVNEVEYPQSKEIEIWLLNDFNGKQSWTKLCTIGPVPVCTYPVGFVKNSEFLLLQIEGQLVLCDPGTQEMKNLPVKGSSFEYVVYNENLVSFKGGNSAANRVTSAI